ncbi:nitroreductase [Bifidobacterium sp. LC6]|uniref:Nitroreductase n=1 Tax=Bifidobacterium colobi TaxID=2809026 RepID=A0ABS5UXT4_9BIFI|nr:nitroreductase family protein [Bifidobacterium colobi]MBT1175938.1 nitroreductase [Bifidobacterium colobi]
MNLLEAMKERHAVRNFTDEPLSREQIETLSHAIAKLNAAHGLDIQLIHDADDALGGCPTHYGRFAGVHNLIALIGADDAMAPEVLDERVGYAGEVLALTAVSLGLDTSWVVLHEADKHEGAWTLGAAQRMPAAIVLGHGARPGRAHRSKPAEELGVIAPGGSVNDYADAPQWFRDGIEAVMLAPSALGKQPVRFTLLDDARTVKAEALDGVQAHICLGIDKLHFELGAGTGNFEWAE